MGFMPTKPKKGWRYTGTWTFPVDISLHDELVEKADEMRKVLLDQHNQLRKFQYAMDEHSRLIKENIKLREEIEPLRKLERENSLLRSRTRTRQKQLNQIVS